MHRYDYTQRDIDRQSYYFKALDYDFKIDSALERRISSKWNLDSIGLPLAPAYYGLYRIIHAEYFRRFSYFPNLNPARSFNEKMQWLKLFDQRYETVRCSDKIEVKSFASERIGNKYIVPVHQVASMFGNINFASLPTSFVLKTNHDSGSVFVVRDKNVADLTLIGTRLNDALKRPYGWMLGEWAYRFVRPKVFAEKLIDSGPDALPPDFKFFCVNGKVKFLHYIYDRSSCPKEIIVDPSGRVLDARLYTAFEQGIEFNRPVQWEEMIWISETLSQDFQFVRVDLYERQGDLFVGELTFWPMSGFYMGAGQVELGKLLEIDQNKFRPFVLGQMERRQWA